VNDSTPVGAPARADEVLESTVALCPYCLTRLEARIVVEHGQVFLVRSCPDHGLQRDLLEEDQQEFLTRRRFNNPGRVHCTQTRSRSGCPFDCGLCPEHAQHTCIALIEITGACDLRCPLCYAASADGSFLSADAFERMLDFALASEGGQLEILQLSGGEPTLHPEWEKLVAMAQAKGVKYVLLNTHGLKLLDGADVLEKLASFQSRFEVYLQFDGLSDAVYRQLRGRPLARLKLEVLEILAKRGIPTTLVASVAAGINDDEIGATIVQALRTPAVRGVNFQPAAYFGRVPAQLIERTRRMTLSGVMRRIESQMKQMIRREHLIPLPCDADQVAVGYFHTGLNGSFAPMIRRDQVLGSLPQVRNTLRFTPEEMVTLAPACAGPGCCSGLAAQIQKFFPKSFFHADRAARARMVSESTFRISITSFLDAYNFDLRSCQRECVHVITEDLRKIPFSAYNLYHRTQAS
jgi:7,8-dihydro-6-hydroxymethylpterin dimethyltransferase